MNKIQDHSFFKGEDWKLNACLNFSSDMTHGYVMGYHRATKVLLEYIKEKEIYQDSLVYPVLFLFRHYIEIQLKDIISLATKVLDQDLTPEDLHQLNQAHDIAWLWVRVKELLKEIMAEYPKDYSLEAYLRDSVEAEEMLDKLHELDPKSFSFRYSKDKNGNSRIDSSLRIINFDVINQGRESLFQTLEAIKGLIGECLALKEMHEMESGLVEEMASAFHEEQQVESEDA